MAHARQKRRALERTRSKSLQIVNLLYCIAFQITNQDYLRIGPFQSLRFRRACTVRSLECFATALDESLPDVVFPAYAIDKNQSSEN